MFHVKDHKTQHLFDPWGYLGPRRRKLLKRSWAGLFQEEILPILPVEMLRKSFSPGMGRPTKELHCMLGVALLQQTFDLTDEQVVNDLAFDTMWHYALNITDESDESKCVGIRTLEGLRHLLIKLGIEDTVFDGVTAHLAKVFKANVGKQRLDSVLIKSNMKRLGRIGIFSKSIRRFLVNLKRHHGDLFSALPPELSGRYLDADGEGCFSRVKPSESAGTLKMLASDLHMLVERFKDTDAVASMTSYKLLTRILAEQCTVKETGDGSPVEVEARPSKEVPSSSLQNPSDPDATYNGHKGQGFLLQIMESHGEGLSLLTHAEVRPAHESDASALVPAIVAVEERGLVPEELLADSLYGGDANVEAAREMGVELISPTMGQSAPGISMVDFERDATGRIARCPAGFPPVLVESKGEEHTVVFGREGCEACARRGECPVRKRRKGFVLRYSDKQARIADRRKHECTDGFLERYRMRAGVEGSISCLDRRTGVKRLRIRGLPAVRFCAKMKAAGMNILRATAFRTAENRRNIAGNGENSRLSAAISILRRVWKTAASVTKGFMTRRYCHRSDNRHTVLRFAA